VASERVATTAGFEAAIEHGLARTGAPSLLKSWSRRR